MIIKKEHLKEEIQFLYQKKKKKPEIPTTPTKKDDFESKVGGEPSSYDMPEPEVTPTPAENKNEKVDILNQDLSKTGGKVDEKSGDASAKDGAFGGKDGQKVDSSEAAKLALNNDSNLANNIEKNKSGGDPSNNKEMKKAEQDNAQKKAPCNENTDKCVRQITKFRHVDYKTFQRWTSFGENMKNLISEFQKEYAFSKNPSKLSNKHFQGKNFLYIF